MALCVGAGFSFNTSTLELRGSEYSVVEEASRSSTVCPLGWIYAGKLGCIYLNTDNDKVLTGNMKSTCNFISLIS